MFSNAAPDRAFLLCVALLGLPACTTEDVDCFEACPADESIIDFEKGTSQGTLFVEGGIAAVLSDGALRISGQGDGASFGVRFPCIKQAGKFDGLFVHVVNNAASVRLAWELETIGNAPATEDSCQAPGSCEGDCADSINSISINQQFGVARQWSNFTGGNPNDHPAPNELIGMRLRLPDNVGNVDLVIDELRFHTNPLTP